MAINLDLTETDPSRAGGFPRVAAGKAHVIVTDFKPNHAKNGDHEVYVSVLAHSDASQVSMTHREQYSTQAKMAWKILGFLYATKVANKDAMTAAKNNGQAYAPIEEQHSIGRQFFCTFTHSEKDGKTYCNIDYPIAIDDPEAKNFPHDSAALARALGSLPPAGTVPAAPVQQTPATPAPGAGVNPFGALAAGGQRPA